jgi:hypothetical protein
VNAGQIFSFEASSRLPAENRPTTWRRRGRASRASPRGFSIGCIRHPAPLLIAARKENSASTKTDSPQATGTTMDAEASRTRNEKGRAEWRALF